MTTLLSQGLFSYQTWNGMDGFWQNGVVLETMANAMHYLNFTRFVKQCLHIYQNTSYKTWNQTTLLIQKYHFH